MASGERTHNDTTLYRNGVKLKDKLTYVNTRQRLGIEEVSMVL